MSELNNREQLPLLAEEGCSDEDLPYSEGRRFWRSTRRNAPLRGRATSKMRGASAIILQWPNHVSSSVSSCWVAFFLLLVVFIVLYGVIMTCSVIPINRYRYGRGLHNMLVSKNITGLEILSTQPQVFCPIIVNMDDKFELTSYVEPFNNLKSKYPSYDYNIIILINDTDEKSAKDNNLRAMNYILNHETITNEIEKTKEDLSFNVQKHLLSSFIERSPLKGKWKTLAPYLMPFLARAVSIWESGGISFDPNVIKDGASHLVGLKYHIEETLRDFSEDIPYKAKYDLISAKMKTERIGAKKMFNNIRDVIDHIEKNHLESKSQVDLKGEESKISPGPVMRKLLSTTLSADAKISVADNILNANNNLVVNQNTDVLRNIVPNSLIKKEDNETSKDRKIQEFVDTTFIRLNQTKNLNVTRLSPLRNINSKIDLVPYFFNILFNTDPNDRIGKATNSPKPITYFNDNNVKLGNNSHMSKRSTITRSLGVMKNAKEVPNIDIITFGKDKTNNTEHTPVYNKGNVAYLTKTSKNSHTIIKEENNKHKTDEQQTLQIVDKTPKINDDIKLVVDVSGELIATKASCHAYIGHIFNTVQKHADFTSTAELIDKSLLSFCRNMTNSSCDGIKLVL